MALERLVFIDESSSHIGMTYEWGRAPRGERVHGTMPRSRGTATTMIGAMDGQGLKHLDDD